MKKTLLTTFLTAVVLTGCATTPQLPQEPVKLEHIYTIEKLSQEQIYNGARQWFSTAFVSSKAVIDYEDKAAGTIIGKASTQYTCAGISECLTGTTNDRLEFTIRVDTKDQKVRVTYSDLTYFRPAHRSGNINYPDTRREVTPNSNAARLNVAKLDAAVQNLVNKVSSHEKTNNNW